MTPHIDCDDDHSPRVTHRDLHPQRFNGDDDGDSSLPRSRLVSSLFVTHLCPVRDLISLVRSRPQQGFTELIVELIFALVVELIIELVVELIV